MGALEASDPWHFEKQAWARGFKAVAGLDEAGRGPLAGPVVAAAVVLPAGFDGGCIRDSKQMTAAARDAAYDCLMDGSCRVGIGIIGPEVIDEVNILRATNMAMAAALSELGAVFDFVLVDGLRVTGLPAESLSIVKGDSKSVSIGAASIVAKVTRDRIMFEMDGKYPEYGFAGHKGYGSADHLRALDRHGPCPCHRKSFGPVQRRMPSCRLPGLD